MQNTQILFKLYFIFVTVSFIYYKYIDGLYYLWIIIIIKQDQPCDSKTLKIKNYQFSTGGR